MSKVGGALFEELKNSARKKEPPLSPDVRASFKGDEMPSVSVLKNVQSQEKLGVGITERSLVSGLDPAKQSIDNESMSISSHTIRTDKEPK